MLSCLQSRLFFGSHTFYLFIQTYFIFSSFLKSAYILYFAIYKQCDQKENKSEQALQIIGIVVAEFFANKRSSMGIGIDRPFMFSNATL
jgi:hypothetical protein